MSGLFNLTSKRLRKLQKVFAWVSILSLVLQMSSGLLFARPAFAEEESSSPGDQTEGTADPSDPVDPPADPTPTEPLASGDTPTPTPTEGAPTPTPTIEVTPTEIPSEPPAEPPVDPNLIVGGVQGSAGEGLDLGPEGTDAQSAQLNPSISTDKEDYAPTDTATISGSNFPASIDVLIKVTWPDGIVRDNAGLIDSSDTITTDEEGSFTYLYSLRGEGQEGEYLLEVFQGATVLATKVFSDTAPSCPADKILICHHLGSGAYNSPCASKTADAGGHSGSSHQDGKDIIPPFEYAGGSYPGQNWDVAGQAIWNNGCAVLSCGNGQVEVGEECDDGNEDNTDSCLNTCLNATCGDTYLWAVQEQCDDGNTDNGDGCSSTCQTEQQECVKGPTWASSVVNNSQGNKKGGGSITDPARTDPNKTLGVNDGVFYSLGYGGWITLTFEGWIMDIEGDDLSFHETTGGRPGYPVEKALVEVSQDGTNWVSLGEVDNKAGGDGVAYKDLNAVGLTWIKFVRITDTTNDPSHKNDADGYDLDAVDAIAQICEEPGDQRICGNGVVEGNEQCDDENQNNDDYCSNDCQWNQVCLPGVNMLVNGGFETPEVTHEKGWNIFDSGTAGLGWTVEWYDGETSFGGQTRPEPAHLELQRAVKNWIDFEGEQYAELDSDWDGPGGALNGEPASVSIYQDLPTVAGYQYQIDFAYSPRPDTVASNNELEFSWDGDVKDTLIQAGGSNTVWTTHSYTFIATGSLTWIMFTDVGDVDSFGPFIDDVSVICLGEEQECGNDIKEGTEECDGQEGVTSGVNFCTHTCELVPIYDGDHTCPVDTVPVLVDGPYEIFGNDPNGINVAVTPGTGYLFEVSGTFKPSQRGEADAGFTSIDNWATTRPGYGIYGTPPDLGAHALLGDFGSGVGIIDWGSYNPSHVYTKYYEPAGSSLQFLIGDRYDNWFNTSYNNQGGMDDNSGDLTLNVYECQPTSDVTVCKYDDSGAPLSGWNVSLKGELVETVNVLPDGSDYDSNVLGEGDYVLEASDYYTYRPGTAGAEYTDANYSKRHPSDAVYGGPYVPWVNVNTFPASHTGWLGVMVNGSATNWSDYYNPEHIYTLGYLNYSGNFSFKILDDNYSDNSGQIPVAIYRGYAGTTGDNGCVTFEDVPYGSYLLDEVLKNNWINLSGKGSSVFVDELQETFTLVNREMFGPISGVKWEDLNHNGFRDAGDDALSGWTINLWNGASVVDPSLPADQTTTTAGDGSYQFENLPWGDYTVCEEDRAGWEQTFPGGGTCYYLTVGGNIKPADDIDFGNFELGMIQGKKYEDLNNDSTRDAGEPYLNDWTIRAYKKNGSVWDPIGTFNTGDTGTIGQYRFEDLGKGTYYICEVLEPGWVQSDPGASEGFANLSSAFDEASRCRRAIINQSGQSRTSLLFGNIQYGSIKACKYDDYDGDGKKDENEPGILGVTINLFEETLLDFFRKFDGDGEKPIDSCETDENGCCTFENLYQGDYRVEEDLNDPDLVGYKPTSLDSVPAMVTPGQETLVDFFNELQPITLELDKENSVSGSTVTYTISVHNTSPIVAHDVYVNDLLPLGFTYNTGTTKIDGLPAGDPNGLPGQLLTWSLGDIDPDDTITITYDVTVGSLPDGSYPNDAVAWGDSRESEHPDNERAYSNFDFSSVKIVGGVSPSTPIGGTRMTVLGAVTAIPQVLGAATGSETYWLMMAFLMILAGVSIMFLTKERRGWLLKKITVISKKLSLFASFVLVFALALFAFAGGAQAIDSLFIRVAGLPEYKRTDNFKLYYTALEKEKKLISVVCYVEKDGGFGWKTFGGTQTDPAGFCEVFGHELDGDGKYRFKTSATSSDGSTESNLTGTTIDREGPEAPKDYRKSREGSTAFRIFWKNPGNDDYAFTRIFASTERNFTADDATKKADIGGNPDQEQNHLVTGLEPDKEYYFALQGFDKAGNPSGLAGDGGSVTYEEVLGEAVAGEGVGGEEVVVLPMEEGVGEGAILGEEEVPAEEATVEEGVTGLIGGAATQIAGTNKSLLAAGAGILIILAGLGFYFYRKQTS